MRSLGFYKKNLTVVLIIFLAVTPIVRADNEENKVRIEYSIQSSPAYAGNIIEVSLWKLTSLAAGSPARRRQKCV